jgi:1-acyl-sn-glycerol-3-phosphate acyltransferase
MKSWSYEPARDLELPLPKRLQSPQRECSLFSVLLGLPWWLATRAYFKIWHRLEVTGRDNLPETPRFIFAANHTSHLDALILACALPLRWSGHVYPIAAGDTFFDNRCMRAFAALILNALPLWRRRIQTHALEEFKARLLAEDNVFILFPEGTRTRDGRLGRFKPGIGRLTAGTVVKVVPCHVAGGFRALPPGKTWPRPMKIRVSIGKPLTFEEIEPARQGWNEVAETLQHAVASLALAAPSAGPGASDKNDDNSCQTADSRSG